jgi:glucokinase
VEYKMILAGDIGGTKTVLALFSRQAGVAGGAIHETRFESGKYSSLEAIIVEFLRETRASPVAACFGVAGPVINQRSQITNLSWTISAQDISTALGIPDVYLLNDLEATAIAVPHLQPQDLHTLNEGIFNPGGNIAVVSPGTGLGTAFLVRTGDRYQAFASEGGHATFSPRNLQEMELLKYLKGRYNHVSFERICSGSHLPGIYDFFLGEGSYPEPEWLHNELAAAPDRTPVIVEAALAEKADICEATLDTFVQVLGTAVGNLAVTLLPTGGIYLGGGIPPRILGRLKQPDFLGAIADKGRFSQLCSSMPVHVILTPSVALYGAAWHGLESSAH